MDTTTLKQHLMHSEAVGNPHAAAVLRAIVDGLTAIPSRVDAAQPAHIADPSGGATVDAEARTAINAILAALEAHGITASS